MVDGRVDFGTGLMVDRVPVGAAVELGAGFGLTDVAVAGGLLAKSR